MGWKDKSLAERRDYSMPADDNTQAIKRKVDFSLELYEALLAEISDHFDSKVLGEETTLYLLQSDAVHNEIKKIVSGFLKKQSDNFFYIYHDDSIKISEVALSLYEENF